MLVGGACVPPAECINCTSELLTCDVLHPEGDAMLCCEKPHLPSTSLYESISSLPCLKHGQSCGQVTAEVDSLIFELRNPLPESNHAVQMLQVTNGELLHQDVCVEDGVIGLSFTNATTPGGAVVNIHMGD